MEIIGCKGVNLSAWREKRTPKYTRQALCDAFRAGENPPMELFWGHQPARDGRITNSCLSQWWISEFWFHGLRMCCMEQCMMWGKAQIFEDEEIAKKILECDDPQKIKKLGRQVRSFDQQTWDEVKYALILEGNYSKFTHNDELRRFLLSTGDSVLVEASPYDCVWGVGLGAATPDVKDPHKWRGENLLGFALMEVRDEIRRAYENEALCCGAGE